MRFGRKRPIEAQGEQRAHRDILEKQWIELRRWIEESGALDHADEQSVLDAWNIRELVTHLGRSFLALTVLGPGDGTEPRSLRRYLADYGGSAQEIADGTRELARSISDDVLAGVDQSAALGFRALDKLTADVVRGPRGAITLDDFVMTRLIEVVVHGDDLARSLPGIPAPPLLDAAIAAVDGALAQVYLQIAGARPVIEDPLVWLRQATGRTSSDDSIFPLL